MTDDEVTSLWRAARAAWPGVNVELASFAEHLAHVGGADGRTDASTASARLRSTNLYLACACAGGDATAMALFEKTFFDAVDTAAAALASRGVGRDELRQAVRERLFLGRDGAPGKIAAYSGRGELGAWLRMVATRAALNLAASRSRELPVERDALAFLVGVGDDPELAYLRRTYADTFRAAFREAFEGLDDRDQNLVRYAFGEGLSVDEIGKVYGVHRATAARWLVTAHSTLAKRVRASLVERLGVTHKDYESIVRWMQSHLDVTFDSYVNPAPSKASPRDQKPQ